jgi:hypothetical protein
LQSGTYFSFCSAPRGDNQVANLATAIMNGRLI